MLVIYSMPYYIPLTTQTLPLYPRGGRLLHVVRPSAVLAPPALLLPPLPLPAARGPRLVR